MMTQTDVSAPDGMHSGCSEWAPSTPNKTIETELSHKETIRLTQVKDHCSKTTDLHSTKCPCEKQSELFLKIKGLV